MWQMFDSQLSLLCFVWVVPLACFSQSEAALSSPVLRSGLSPRTPQVSDDCWFVTPLGIPQAFPGFPQHCRNISCRGISTFVHVLHLSFHLYRHQNHPFYVFIFGSSSGTQTWSWLKIRATCANYIVLAVCCSIISSQIKTALLLFPFCILRNRLHKLSSLLHQKSSLEA